ncbi:MAG: tRNA uridine-5-carboxymethylaminomethyl(34) synthesis GTPase MnmE [Proteobacteria bacterium]|nr:tRNA uridine-5-carboxymethylaminomethyl(34) synthesis GTPase MnmE [Pseudomonadota bacterium]
MATSKTKPPKARHSETIFALATPGGRSAIQVIRVSGEATKAVVLAHMGRVPKPRVMTYTAIGVEGTIDYMIDRGMVVFFSTPHSPTGEDYAEFHLHGSPQIATLLMRSFGRMPRVRLAEAGEFTRRAFLAGKLTLDQAEAIADMIDADTIAQHRQAMARFDAPLSHVTESWRGDLISLLAETEAALDFADEDIPDSLLANITPSITTLIDKITNALAEADKGLAVRDGVSLVLLGRPNVGKSTLLNTLVGRDDAIVSTEAGTTRDIIQATMDIAGYAVHLKDTAGIRTTDRAVEGEGVRRAKTAAQEADMVLCLIDSGDAERETSLARLLDEAGIDPQNTRPRILPLISKSDLNPPPPKHNWLAISAKTGSGLDKLKSAIKTELDTIAVGGETALVVRHRHRLALEDCLTALRAATTIDPATSPELLAEELRTATLALGRIAGRVDVEDILDEIFASFCIGK